ncbi:IclR family transcriptional regulator [Haloplanus litoreus]|uniref:IclR family transcriptional regulator n=1 Tax=Haloplanus litoreus TaxID=767515 RepID=A0ABD5ZYL9_9EURY
MTSNPPSDSGRNRIQAVDNAFEIILALREKEWTGVSELANELELPKSTVHVYLSTLHDIGFLTKKEGKYRLSLRFLELGGNIRQQIDIFRTARHQIDELSNRTGEVANLGVEENGWRVLLYSAEPPEGLFDNAPTGEFKPMHWTALGKALLAQCSDERIEEIVEREGLPAATDHTITDPNRLFEEIERIRERGYSIEDEEHHESIKAIGVPVKHVSDPPLRTAVSISGPKSRIGEGDKVEDLLQEIQSTVNVIELEYEYY